MKTAVAILLVNKGRILIHEHKVSKMYLAPGGKVNRDEDPKDAALRELKEETGLTIDSLNFYKSEKDSNGYMVHFYWADYKKSMGNVLNKEPDKCVRLFWCPINQIPQLYSLSSFKALIKAFSKEYESLRKRNSQILQIS